MARKKLPPEVLDYFRDEGAKGGKAAAKAMAPEERTARAKKAGLASAAARKAKKKPAEG